VLDRHSVVVFYAGRMQAPYSFAAVLNHHRWNIHVDGPMLNPGEGYMHQSLQGRVMSRFSRHVTRWCVSVHDNGNNHVAICDGMGEGL
jgi:hypothetical protein